MHAWRVLKKAHDPAFESRQRQLVDISSAALAVPRRCRRVFSVQWLEVPDAWSGEAGAAALPLAIRSRRGL